MQFVPLILVAAAFFMVVVRPQRERLRQVAELQRTLATGADVVTTAGLYGTVVALEDDTVLLSVAPGVELRFARGAIARTVTPALPAEADLDATAPGEAQS